MESPLSHRKENDRPSHKGRRVTVTASSLSHRKESNRPSHMKEIDRESLSSLTQEGEWQTLP